MLVLEVLVARRLLALSPRVRRALPQQAALEVLAEWPTQEDS
jgi:hypothetical protein